MSPLPPVSFSAFCIFLVKMSIISHPACPYQTCFPALKHMSSTLCCLLSSSFSPLSIIFIPPPVSALPLLFHLWAYLCVCICTHNSLTWSVHQYLRPLRAPFFLCSCFSSTTVQEEGLRPATVCVNRRVRMNKYSLSLFRCGKLNWVLHVWLPVTPTFPAHRSSAACVQTLVLSHWWHHLRKWELKGQMDWQQWWTMRLMGGWRRGRGWTDSADSHHFSAPFAVNKLF